MRNLCSSRSKFKAMDLHKRETPVKWPMDSITHECRRDCADARALEVEMDAKEELLTCLQQIVNEHLGVKHEEVTEDSTWAEFGADSLDRLQISLSLENALNIEIPHSIGERLNTVGETVNHLLARRLATRDNSNVRIEAVHNDQQWAEALNIRTEVFSTEYGYPLSPLPGVGESGFWHLLARDKNDAIGVLSVMDTTGNRQVHQQNRLSFGKKERVARYAQLAILKPYRKRGIFEMLIETAQKTVIRPHGFTVEWLLYPAALSSSSKLIRLGFTAETKTLATEFGKCHVLVRRASSLACVSEPEQPFSDIETRRGQEHQRPNQQLSLRRGV
jgi:acyl carrier protein